MGTIKQRSPTNHYNTITVDPSLDTMKRSLPNEFFQQPSIHSVTKITVPIYDNNERCIRKNTPSLYKQKRKASLPSNTDKSLQFIEPLKQSNSNKSLK